MGTEQAHWPALDERRVLLAVSGGIAAYKAAELCRLLTRCGAKVDVLMTRAAREFVGEATFAALSGRGVGTSLWAANPRLGPAGSPQVAGGVGHIELADAAELLLVAPATANLLASFAHGMAHDLVTTVYLAYTGPVLIAPAMNVHMWAHPATRANVEILRQRGHAIVGPEEGEMACGHVGAGRLADPELILQAAGAALAVQDLVGRRILISAGSTREAIDPVRFISNRSTGKMGFALAAEAAARGAEVTLVSGPTDQPSPRGVERVAVCSADEMASEVEARADGQDAVIMAAAVADYRPVSASETKLKKEQLGARPSIALERTKDILATLGERKKERGEGPFLVGFAAETAGGDAGELLRLARDKIARKGCDLIVANDVSAADAGFASDDNRVVIIGPQGIVEDVPLMSKRQVAVRILTHLASGWGFGDAVGAGDGA